MYKGLAVLLMLSILISLAFWMKANENNGFDEICKIYTEALSANMSKEQKFNYIWDNIERRVISRDAIAAYSAVANADPALKYDLFKQAAEISLKRKWDCDVIKQFK